MVSSSTVRGDFRLINSKFSDYDAKIDSLSDSWKGLSYDNIKNVTNSFSSGTLPIIKTIMDSFAKACDEYEKFEANREKYLKYDKKVTEYVGYINGFNAKKIAENPKQYYLLKSRMHDFERQRDRYKEKYTKNINNMMEALNAAKASVDKPSTSLVSYSIPAFKYESNW